MDLKRQFGLTTGEIIEMVDGLCDDDFFDVMLGLAKKHNCANIEKFGEWLKDVMYEIADEVDERVEYEVNSTPEIGYITQFAEEGDFEETIYREQLRALWTAYCLHHNLDVDTGTYDIMLHSVWIVIRQDWDFDDFDEFMCKYLI